MYLYIILALIWLFFGYTTVRMIYYGAIRDWYRLFKLDYREYNNGSTLKMINSLGIILIPGGLISLLFAYIVIGKEDLTWYFEIPKKQ